MKDLTIVVGTIGQSIMRSEDNGQTWARIGPRRGFAYEASVRCIAMNPQRPNTLFAGTERGLYRSEDRERTGNTSTRRSIPTISGPSGSTR